MNPWGALIARLTADPYERRWASSVWLHPGRDDVNTTALIKQQKWATDRGWRMPNTNNPQAAAPRGWDSVGPAGDSDTYRTGPDRGQGGMPPPAQPYQPKRRARTNTSGGNGMASLGEVKGQMADAEKDMEDAEKLDAAGDKAMDESVAGSQTAQQKAEEGKQNFEAAKQKAESARDKFNAAAEGSDDDNAKRRAAEAQKAADDAQKALDLAENARAAAEEAEIVAAAAKGGSEEAAASSSAARQGIGDYHPKL